MSLVVICSLVRDGMSYLPSFRRQLESLMLDAEYGWHLCILEGDSCDGTWDYLERWATEDRRITIGKENVGDTFEMEERAARWARAGNACFALIPQDRPYTHVLWLESDLCFPPELAKRLLRCEVDIVAPMIWLGGLFYDTWGFRDINGQRWTNEAPYHPEYCPMSLIEMGSVGSCVLFRREILDAGVRFKGTYENGLLVGMCNEARSLGFKVFADTSIAILHPVGNWEAQMWRPTRITVTDREGVSNSLTLNEAKSLGLEMNLAALDSKLMLNTSSEFWFYFFTKYRTNNLHITLLAQPYPERLYQMMVVIETPSLLCRVRKILKFLLRKRDNKFVQKIFKCIIDITICKK